MGISPRNLTEALGYGTIEELNMKKGLVMAAVAALLWGCGAGKDGIVLKFRDDGHFKVVQFTDTHLEDTTSAAVTARTYEVMRSVVKQEDPDLVILTGDNVCGLSLEPTRELAHFLDSLDVPYGVVMGSHDLEAGTADEIFGILGSSRWFVGSQGPKDVDGVGNYDLPVMGHLSGRPAAVLYCFNSHSYIDMNSIYGCYEWIHKNQVDWYCARSAAYTQANGGVPLPSLAFSHIPLPEIAKLWGTQFCTGSKGERECVPSLNSGLACAFTQNGDVIGAFSGNDHSNDFGGLIFDLGLFYGKATGSEKTKEPGARVIDLTEGERSYTTWVTTEKGREQFFYYPSGVSSEDEQKMDFLPALSAQPTQKGVAYKYWEFPDDDFRFGEIENGTLKDVGTMPNFSIDASPAHNKDCFMYEFEALIDIPLRGVYTFGVHADEKAQLFIDGQLVVDANNRQAHYERSKVALEGGFHHIRLGFLEKFWGQRLTVYIGDKTGLRPIPDEVLYVEP